MPDRIQKQRQVEFHSRSPTKSLFYMDQYDVEDLEFGAGNINNDPRV